MLPSFILTGPLPQYDYQYSDKLIITGASTNHAYGSFNLLYSIILADPFVSILYIDLGITLELLTILNSHFITIHQIQRKLRSDGFLSYRKYNWKSFPKWMNLYTDSSQRGGYSWKVIPIVDAFFEWKGQLSWLDSGCILMDGFSREFTLAKKYGVFTPRSSGNMGKWTHPDCIHFMKKNNMISHYTGEDTIYSGGILYLDYSKKITHILMKQYEECAYTQRCITPRGSNRTNHRQDQSALSLLINSYGILDNMKRTFRPALRNEHFDIVSLTNLILSIQQVYHITINSTIYNISSLSYHKPYYPHSLRVVEY